ncbi:unnamed protein product [Camellia sinensis]
MRRSTAAGVVPRSCSVGMGSIDEERPCEFGDNNYNGVNVRKELLVYPRSRSYAVTKTSVNGTSEEVKNIVFVLNASEVPSQNVVGNVVEVVVSPYVFLPLVKDLLRPNFHIAAQNCWVKKGGAFTGEVSAEMLVNMGIPWVILGHSEMRALLNKSNEVIACIGETLEQRELGSTMDVVTAQTKAISGSLPRRCQSCWILIRISFIWKQPLRSN